jgi:hypothetical protein
MRVIEKEHADDLRSVSVDDSFELIICEDKLGDSGRRFNEDICLQVHSGVFANPRSRKGFFDSVGLLLNFLTDDGPNIT